MAAIDEMNVQPDSKETASDEERLQALMDAEDSKMEDGYLSLGKAYMDLHETDYESALAPLAQAILASREAKNNYRREYMALKGIAICENCGAEVPENALFCSSCGHKMPAPKVMVPEGSVRCGRCGALQPTGALFCMNCGNSLSEPKAAAESSAPEETKTTVEAPASEGIKTAAEMKAVESSGDTPTPVETPPIQVTPLEKEPEDWELSKTVVIRPSRAPRCLKCGSILEADAIFCTECGARQR